MNVLAFLWLLYPSHHRKTCGWCTLSTSFNFCWIQFGTLQNRKVIPYQNRRASKYVEVFSTLLPYSLPKMRVTKGMPVAWLSVHWHIVYETSVAVLSWSVIVPTMPRQDTSMPQKNMTKYNHCTCLFLFLERQNSRLNLSLYPSSACLCALLFDPKQQRCQTRILTPKTGQQTTQPPRNTCSWNREPLSLHNSFFRAWFCFK